MKARSNTPFAIGRAAIFAGLVAVAVPVPAAAQVDSRLERIEREINALQRAVFPGGDERFFEPEITPQAATTTGNANTQATTSALTDVLARLDAIEQQLARLTAATEVNENALATLEMRILELEASAIAVPEEAVTTAATETGSDATGVIEAPGEDAVEVAADNAETAGPSDERLAAVQAIAKPATGDQGDDEYVYGFRLWDAGFYPEAQQQLALFVEAYPDHWRTTYGRNLLGRAFLDDGNPRSAATHFLENYQADPAGARAPHSLLFLAESMIELGDTRRACIALSVFGEEYPALAAGEMLGQYEGLSGRVDCN
ncbi:tetratricopeptide repeat protein [Aurantiacibacter gilvus]|uniref:TolA-binding protein n=1 Tax=Aurantiacibacter gilvus TaxID=3139141 RepID=A0ABU9IBP2_9SPHN